MALRYGHQQWSEGSKDMPLKRMDNVLIVVDDLEAVKAFFIELGLKLEGETTVEGAFDRETDRAQGSPGHPRDDADSRWAGH